MPIVSQKQEQIVDFELIPGLYARIFFHNGKVLQI